MSEGAGLLVCWLVSLTNKPISKYIGKVLIRSVSQTTASFCKWFAVQKELFPFISVQEQAKHHDYK